MFGAGVPIDRALQLLATQSEDPTMKSIAADLDKRIGQGLPLHAAFECQKGAFSEIQLGLLRVGERSGGLQQVLFSLADYEQRRRELTMKVRSALTYPAFLMILTTFMLVVIPPYLFRGLFAMLENSQVELPLISRIVVAVSGFIRTPDFWALCFGAMASLAVVQPMLLRHRGFRLNLVELTLRVPVLGRFYRVLVTTRFARAMEILLKVGEGPLQGLPTAAQAAGCPVLKERIVHSVAALKGGSNFVEALTAAEFFPDSFLLTLRAGEESAQLVDIMARTTQMYESELNHSIDTLTDLLEPMIMLFMGIIVGVVIVATMLPMMAMLRTL